MNNSTSIACLVVAAGSGSRFGGDVPKQYLPLWGKPVLRWSLDKIQAFSRITHVCVAISQENVPLYHAATAGLDLLPPVIGGATRQETVRLGLEALALEKPKSDYVLIHDAARPCFSPALLEKLCLEVQKSTAVIPGLPVTDTIRRMQHNKSKTENRDGLHTIQTPQAFHFETILDLHRKYKDIEATDDAALCEHENILPRLIAGERDNIKITHAHDLPLAESILAQGCPDLRTGYGYDVHRLIPSSRPSDKLMLCGVAVPHTHMLEGHSDADVALHALTDALLGAICAGDIGQHFSPQDPRWKNADSAAFLSHAADLIQRQGGLITHTDITIICEEPKIGPHREKMRSRIAKILSLPQERVSVKATTTEGLGFTGRKEGIAAQAIATVRLPFIKNLPHNTD